MSVRRPWRFPAKYRILIKKEWRNQDSNPHQRNDIITNIGHNHWANWAWLILHINLYIIRQKGTSNRNGNCLVAERGEGCRLASQSVAINSSFRFRKAIWSGELANRLGPHVGVLAGRFFLPPTWNFSSSWKRLESAKKMSLSWYT